MQLPFIKKRTLMTIFIIFGLFVGLYLISTYSYLLFHSLVEIFGIIVVCSIFMLAWNARRLLDNNYFIFIGIAYLFSGGVDLLHTLAYKGMNVFPGADANLPTQLWIAARYMESISLVIAPLTIGRRLYIRWIIPIFSIVTVLMLSTIFYWKIFPTCFVEGEGLTFFKTSSEVIITGLMAVSIYTLYIKRDAFDRKIFNLLIASIAVGMVAELALIFYRDVTGFFNFIGHYAEIISFVLFYNAIIVSGLTKPYATLFKNLKDSELSLIQARSELRTRVDQRTAELLDSNARLIKEIEDHKTARDHLQKNEEILQSIFDGIIDPLIVMDVSLSIKLTNKAAADYYGIKSIEETIGKRCHEIFRGYHEPCPGCTIPALVSDLKICSIERKNRTDPSRIERVYIYPLQQRNTEQKELILRIHDITDSKMLERQIIQNEKMASLGVLVSSVAHEINNPNNFISFNIPILKDYINDIIPILDVHFERNPEAEICNLSYPQLREDIFNLLVNIENGSNRISAFVANLRAYTQDNHTRAVEKQDLRSTIQKVLAICNSKINKSVKEFILNVPEQLPAFSSEPFILEQILINLIVNATQAIDKKDAWIMLNLEVLEKEKMVKIEVGDNGCGIDEASQLKVFDPFFTTKHQSEGTGLGLYVCHTLVERLNGSLTLTSDIGVGSTFTVMFPFE